MNKVFRKSAVFLAALALMVAPAMVANAQVVTGSLYIHGGSGGSGGGAGGNITYTNTGTITATGDVTIESGASGGDGADVTGEGGLGGVGGNVKATIGTLVLNGGTWILPRL